MEGAPQACHRSGNWSTIWTGHVQRNQRHVLLFSPLPPSRAALARRACSQGYPWPRLCQDAPGLGIFSLFSSTSFFTSAAFSSCPESPSVIVTLFVAKENWQLLICPLFSDVPFGDYLLDDDEVKVVHAFSRRDRCVARPPEAE